MMAVLKSCEESRSDGLSYSPSFNFVQIIYQGTLPDSSMRRFLAELYSANADRSWPEYRHKYPAELVEELLISVLDRQARPSGMIDWRDIDAAPLLSLDIFQNARIPSIEFRLFFARDCKCGGYAAAPTLLNREFVYCVKPESNSGRGIIN